MSVNTDLTYFFSGAPIDKIQSWSNTTDSSPGLLVGYRFSIPANPSPGSGLQAGTGSTANPYGKRGLPHLSWSIDQVNWYSTGAQIIYFNSSLQGYVTQIAMYLVCSDSTLTFVAITGYTLPQTIYIQFAVDNPR